MEAGKIGPSGDPEGRYHAPATNPGIFEVEDRVFPVGTSFSEPVELGTFELSYRQMITNAVLSVEYDSGSENESMFLYVAPTTRKTPADSGYLYTGPISQEKSGEAFGQFHMWTSVVPGQDSLFNDATEQEALTDPNGLTIDSIELGVYLSPLGDVEPFNDPDGVTYSEITVIRARAVIQVI